MRFIVAIETLGYVPIRPAAERIPSVSTGCATKETSCCIKHSMSCLSRRIWRFTLSSRQSLWSNHVLYSRPCRTAGNPFKRNLLLLQNQTSKYSSSQAAIRHTKSSTDQQQKSSSSQSTIASDASLPNDKSFAYQTPTTGIISHLPGACIPYVELMRLDKPAGTYYLFAPCLFSTLMAASFTVAPPLSVFTTSLLFFSGALIMRGAGCTINDLWDRNLDPLVSRTHLRPIARGAVAPLNALVFTGFQLSAGLAVLLQFPISCLYYGVPSLLLVTIYPLAKRVTHYPQLVLGLTFSWGAVMGFPALGIDIVADSNIAKAVAALYTSCVSWTVLYDMIYAHMDIRDDARAGIKSIALKHAKETKVILSALAILQIGLLAVSGTIIGASPVFFVGSCGSAAVTLALMIWRVRLERPNSCWWWFKNGVLFTGGGIASGLLAEYMTGKRQQEHSTNVPPSAWTQLILGRASIP